MLVCRLFAYTKIVLLRNTYVRVVAKGVEETVIFQKYLQRKHFEKKINLLQRITGGQESLNRIFQ